VNVNAASRALAAAWLFAASLAQAQARLEGIRVEDAWARSAPAFAADPKAGSGNGAVYARLVNAGAKPDALIAASGDAAEAIELHESYQQSGMMMMREVPAIEVPARGEQAMRPGGYHVMLVNLRRPLEAGQTLRMTFTFRDAGRVPVAVMVR
jgi:copper(I)-binding protein